MTCHPVGLGGKFGDVSLDDKFAVSLDVCEVNPVGKEDLVFFHAQLIGGGICCPEQVVEQGFKVFFGQQVDGGCANEKLLPEEKDTDFRFVFMESPAFMASTG